MKVAIVSREYPPDTAWGGIAIVYYNLARALAERGHQVHVICQAIGKPKDYIEHGVFVHRVGTNPKRYSVVARINYSFRAWLKLKEVIKSFGIEIVDAAYWGAEGFLYTLSKRVPLVVSAQTSAQSVLQTKTYIGKKELLSLKILSLLEDFTVKKAARVVANSHIMYAHLTRKLHINSDRIDIVYHAVDTTKFKFTKSDIRHKLGIPHEARVVLSVGRLEARKGTRTLCEAMPYIVQSKPDVRFVLIGSDTNTAPDGGSFKRYIVWKAQDGNFADNLIFIDFLPEDELIQLYSTCDVFVSASLQESFGLTVIEAMACGRPVVATPVGIVPELQPYGLKGLSIVPTGESQELAEEIINFLSLEDEDKEIIARKNREFVQIRFSPTVSANKIVTVYNKVLEGQDERKGKA